MTETGSLHSYGTGTRLKTGVKQDAEGIANPF